MLISKSPAESRYSNRGNTIEFVHVNRRKKEVRTKSMKYFCLFET